MKWKHAPTDEDADDSRPFLIQMACAVPSLMGFGLGGIVYNAILITFNIPTMVTYALWNRELPFGTEEKEE